MNAGSAGQVIAAVLLCTVGLTFSPTSATGQSRPTPVPRSGVSVATIGKFLGGAALGLGMHEAGHLTVDVLLDARPDLRRVSFAGIPFFAITHRAVSSREEFAISSAGFWVQHLTSEIVLTRDPGLRAEEKPFVKGLLAFNVLTSAAYAGVAFSRYGPVERDTLGMARASRIDERWIGAVVLIPAALDGARYFKPEALWIRWLSRGAKIGGALVILRATG